MSIATTVEPELLRNIFLPSRTEARAAGETVVQTASIAIVECQRQARGAETTIMQQAAMATQQPLLCFGRGRNRAETVACMSIIDGASEWLAIKLQVRA